jgi:hypothetical protein
MIDMKALLIDINDFTKWIDIKYPAPEHIEITLMNPFEPMGSVVFQSDENAVPAEVVRMIKKVFFRKECDYSKNYVTYKERP